MQQEDLKTNLKSILSRSDIPDDVRSSLSSAAIELASPLQTDVWIYRIVTIILGLIVLGTVAGGIYIAIIGKGDATVSLPEGVISIGSAAVGALAGLLAPSPQGK
jgi:hypothetical protein